jgi:hypothetical protein
VTSNSGSTSPESPSSIQSPAGAPTDGKSAPSIDVRSSKTSISDTKVVAKSKGVSPASESSTSRSATAKQLGLLPDKPSAGPSVNLQRVPSEPNEVGERILLAVKLPSGQRLQRYFRFVDKLETVLRFAETESKSDFKGCEFVRADNRETLSDMKKSIRDYGIVDKSVLFLQLPEMP